MKQKSRRQIKAAKKHKENQERREREIADLQASFLRLSTMTTSFSREPHRKVLGTTTGRLVRSMPEIHTPYQRPSSRDIPSVVSLDLSRVEERVITYALSEEDRLRREQEAAAVTRRLKSRVAIPYNKGPYMFVTDDTDPKDLGRK